MSAPSATSVSRRPGSASDHCCGSSAAYSPACRNCKRGSRWNDRGAEELRHAPEIRSNQRSSISTSTAVLPLGLSHDRSKLGKFLRLGDKGDGGSWAALRLPPRGAKGGFA